MYLVQTLGAVDQTNVTIMQNRWSYVTIPRYRQTNVKQCTITGGDGGISILLTPFPLWGPRILTLVSYQCFTYSFGPIAVNWHHVITCNMD